MPKGIPNRPADRAPRAEQVTAERRRRQPGTLDQMQQMKLTVPDKFNEPGYAHRWINDKGNRMHDKTVQDDWDKVPGVEPIPVDTDEHGKPIFAHYCRKPLAFVEEDQAAHMTMLAEREKGLLGGAKSDPQDNRSADVSYVPAGNSLTRAYSP